MSTNPVTIQTVSLPIDALVLSDTPFQVERRQYRTEKDLEELADSIKSVGQIHPIVARPFLFDTGTGRWCQWQIVAGEGRYLGAQRAGLSEIRAEVRELSDEQVEEIQLIENLQRNDLHELVEAEGYDKLMKRGHTAEEIAERVGKSKRTVYTRLQLLKLEDAARKAFRKGELNASTAMLVARLPASVQGKALKEITQPQYGPRDEPMSYRQALDWIQRNYMLRLADAPFSTADAQLVPKAGSCAACPKRTGNNPDLFGDIRGTDVCTDTTCYKLKVDAHQAVVISKAKESGQRVISGADAKKAVAYEHGNSVSLSHSYVAPTDKCWDDPKGRTFKQLLGKESKPIVVKTPGGQVVEAFERSAAMKQLEKTGVIKPPPKARSSSPAKASGKASVDDEKLNARLLLAVREKDGGKLTAGPMRYLLATEIGLGDLDQDLAKQLLGFAPKYHVPDNVKALAKLTDKQLERAMLDVIYMVSSYNSFSGNDFLRQEAKRLGIDPKKIRKELEAELKGAAEKPAEKATKKAPARKK